MLLFDVTPHPFFLSLKSTSKNPITKHKPHNYILYQIYYVISSKNLSKPPGSFFILPTFFTDFEL